MKPEKLRNVHVVPMTAFDDAGQLALEPMRQLITRLAEAGAQVYLPAAGTGEFHSLSEAEIVRVVELVREVAGPDAVVLAPVGLQIGHALSVGRGALGVGADAVLVMPPTAPYLSDVGLRDYYMTILDELDCPTLFYKRGDFPTDDLVLDLASHSNVVGIKYAGTSVDAFQRLALRGAGLTEWLCGLAEPYAPSFMLAGAPGYTTGAGNLAPRVTLAMHAAIRRGDWQEGMRLQRLIRPIEDFRARKGSSYNISALKYAIRVTGLDFGLPRPPQRRLTADEIRELEDIVAPLLAAEEELRG